MQSKKFGGTWDPAAYAATLRDLVQRLRIRQAQIATWAGVRQPQVSRWVAGTSRPGHDAVRRLQTAIIDHVGDDPSLWPLITALGDTAGYPGLPEELVSADRDHGGETRRYRTAVGEITQRLVEDIEAETDGLDDAEADEIVEQALARAREHAVMFVVAERARRARERSQGDA